jgi:hypothetical protein
MNDERLYDISAKGDAVLIEGLVRDARRSGISLVVYDPEDGEPLYETFLGVADEIEEDQR